MQPYKIAFVFMVMLFAAGFSSLSSQADTGHGHSSGNEKAQGYSAPHTVGGHDAGHVDDALIYKSHRLKPIDSKLKVAEGDPAPDFTLPAISGGTVTLSQFREGGNTPRNVVISFVPAAFTPVCSDQWPGYNITKELFEQRDAILLGISTDNIPSLYAWTRQMGHKEGQGVWFPVLSDFWPHGAVADAFGLLRSDGVSDRAIIIIDKQGVIRHINVTDINVRPDLGDIMRALDALQ